GRVQINIVYAHARASDHAKPPRAAQQFVAYSCSAAHYQRIRLGQLARERSRRWLHHLPAGLSQQFDAVFADTVSNNNFHGPKAYRPRLPLSIDDPARIVIPSERRERGLSLKPLFPNGPGQSLGICAFGSYAIV